MTFKSRTTIDMVRIAEAGGGLRFEGRAHTTIDLVRIAEASRKGSARLVLTGMSARTTIDLVRISEAGQGCVVFED